MRRTLVLLFMCLILLLPVFCEEIENTSATATLDFSAYKNPDLPELSYDIRISNFNSDNITGTLSTHSVVWQDQQTNNALTIEIDTNLRSDITIGLYFYPFINEYDSYDLFAVTYTTSTSLMSSTTVQDCIYNTSTYSYSAKWVFGGNFSTSSGNTSIKSISGSGIYGSLTSRITASKLVNGSYVSQNNVPQINGQPTLPGIGTAKVKNTITFNMKPEFNDRTPEANMRYSARVRLVITSV